MWILIAILLVFVAGAAIFAPFLRQRPLQAVAEGMDPKLAELYARRDALYQALRDAKFDLEIGKLSTEDYEQQSARLKHQAADVLRRIDQLEATLVTPELDASIEKRVAERRHEPQELKRSTPRADTPMRAAAGFCTQCGAALVPGDRFCGKCGQPAHS